jgi:small subunit ribosomal protein S16
MSTRIRLRKIGRKKLPLYRIVVADKESPRDGRFIEILGTYDPKQEGAKKIVVDVEKAKSWLAKGATPTDTVEALLKSAGVIAATTPKA